jgi:carboxyvinyl-carboxyphosphonate phosphorylmutase
MKSTTFTERRQRLRNLLAGSVCLSPATVYDALSARVAESVGYQIGILSGSVAGATLLAAPDLVLQTLTEFAAQVRSITRASGLSLVVDTDHGYGNALNVMRSVQELEHAGVAGLMIEDLAMPPRFGSSGLELVSVEEMAGKLRAALKARDDPSLFIMARTAALKAADAKEAAARARAYAATGVDAIYVTGVERLEDFDLVRAAVTLPIAVGPAPEVPREDFEVRGVRLLLQGHQPVAAVVKALRETYSHLHSGGAAADLKSRIATAGQMSNLMNAARYDEWRERYLS